MKILLCAATEREIAPTIHFLTRHPHPSVDLLVTGIGLAASTFALTKAVCTYRPDFILQAGVAGGLSESRPLGSVVAVARESIGDLGVTEQNRFRSLFDMKLLPPASPPFTDGFLVNSHAVLQEAALPVVDGVTVNEISTSGERIHYYRHHLQAEVETMEGAALHYVALLEKIPFLQLRSLSNFIGERNKARWQMEKAIGNLNAEVQRILKTLTV